MAKFLSYDEILNEFPKQHIIFNKTATVTAVANQLQSVIAATGSTSTGSYAVGNTANGIVPTDANSGCPVITDFTDGTLGYVVKAFFTSTVPCNIFIYDRLFSAGSFTMPTTATSYTLTSQPTYAGRLAESDYTGLEIFLESGATPLSNHAHSAAVVYTNELDVTERITASISTQNLISGRMFRFPLVAGDKGVKQINRIGVTGVASATGLFNIHLMRPMLQARINQANEFVIQGPDLTQMAPIYEDSNLYMIIQPDSTSTGIPHVELIVSAKTP